LVDPPLKQNNEQWDARLYTVRVSTAQARSSESTQQREARLETMRVSNAQARLSETTQQQEARFEADRERTHQSRRTSHPDLNCCASSFTMLTMTTVFISVC
jgi:hypothetical protein